MKISRAVFFVFIFVSFLVCRASGQDATITDIKVYRPTSGATPGFIVEIIGTNLLMPESPRILLFPSAGTSTTVLDTADTAIRAEVSGPANYAITEVALSYFQSDQPNHVRHRQTNFQGILLRPISAGKYQSKREYCSCHFHMASRSEATEPRSGVTCERVARETALKRKCCENYYMT